MILAIYLLAVIVGIDLAITALLNYGICALVDKLVSWYNNRKNK